MFVRLYIQMGYGCISASLVSLYAYIHKHKFTLFFFKLSIFLVCDR